MEATDSRSLHRYLSQFEGLDVDTLTEYLATMLPDPPTVADIRQTLELYPESFTEANVEEASQEILSIIQSAKTVVDEGNVENALHSLEKAPAEPSLSPPSIPEHAPAVAQSSSAGAADELDALVRNKPSASRRPKHTKSKKEVAPDLAATLFARNADKPTELLDADSVRVCRHFMAGSCLRDDCPFSHDTSSIPCRYWGTSVGCAMGDACIFFHDPDLLDQAAPGELAEPDVQWAVDTLMTVQDEVEPLETPSPATYDDLFPAALPSSTTRQSTCKASEMTDAQRVSILSLRAAFPSLAQSVIHDMILDGKLSYAEAKCRIEQSFGLSARVYQDKVTKTDVDVPVRPRVNDQMARAIARELSWVSTGDDMAALYRRHRSEAEAYAKARNELLRQATEAYLSGRSADAARLSKEGRSFDAKMREAHLQAARSIRSERNPTAGFLCIADNFVYQVDLHGLHGSEAMEVVDDAIEDASKAARSSSLPTVWIACLVGTRHHSARLGKGGGSIRDAVLRHISDTGLPFYEVPFGTGPVPEGAGVILVKLEV